MKLVENPFFVLGLSAEASRIEVEREAQKLLGMLELGFAEARTYATPLGPRERTAEMVRAAVAALRDPYRRLVAELWARHAAITASSTVGMYGTEAERSLLQEVLNAMEKARRDKDPSELERQMRLAQRLSSAAFNRTPEAWEWYFEDAASEIAKCRDLPTAQRLVTEGKAAIARGDNAELRRVVKALWQQLPESSEARKKGFDSGVR